MTSLPPVLLDRQFLRVELSLIATVHLMAGAVIGLAAADRVVTSGSLPVFTIIPSLLTVEQSRTAWGVVFALAGLFVVALSWRPRQVLFMHLAWCTVGFANGIWVIVLAKSSLIDGQGSALGAVIFLAPLLWSGFAGIRVAQGSGE